MKIKYFFFFTLPLLVISCGDDEETGCTYNSTQIEGKIENEDWAFANGEARFYMDFDGTERIDIEMYSIASGVTDPCAQSSPDFKRIFFSIPKVVQERELNFSFSGGNEEDQQTVTLFDPVTFLNVIVSEGCVEIQTINDTQVTGRMNITSGPDNFMNGTFTLQVCN